MIPRKIDETKKEYIDRCRIITDNTNDQTIFNSMFFCCQFDQLTDKELIERVKNRFLTMMINAPSMSNAEVTFLNDAIECENMLDAIDQLDSVTISDNLIEFFAKVQGE